MNRFEDERLCFYMRHRKIIKQWAAIEKEIPKEAHRFLASLAEDVRVIASEHATEAVPLIALESSYPKLFLVRRNWIGETSDWPKAAIGVEWPKKSVNLETDLPYVGIWVDMRLDDGEQLKDGIVAHCGECAEEHGYKSVGWWPCLKYIGPPNSEFWEDLDPYRSALLDSLVRTWDLFAACVDHVVALAGGWG